MAIASDIKIEQLLEKVLDEMLEGFQVINREWRYLYVNETVARQGKRYKEELIGKTMSEAYPGMDKTPLFKQLQKCMDEKVNIRMDNEFVYPDGSKGWFELFIHPWEGGIMIFSLEITDRKQIEQQLYNKIRELQQLTETSVGREERMTELKEQIKKLERLVPDQLPKIVVYDDPH